MDTKDKLFNFSTPYFVDSTNNLLTVNNMLTAWVCTSNMGGFWALNSLKEGPFFSRFSLNMCGFSRNWQKIIKMGSFQPKFIIKVGLIASVGN